MGAVFGVILSWQAGLRTLPSYCNEPDRVAFVFAEKSDDLNADHISILKGLAAKASKDPQLALVIHESSKGLKISSHAFIIERNRALRIFQLLVREGVDPAHITFASKEASNSNSLIIEASNDPNVANTTRLTPSKEKAAFEGSDFVLNFPSGSAEAINLDQTRFTQFLASVGQPNRDAVVIEGFTDSVGNVAYNLDLGELRAFRVYELMIRAGLPPYRVDTKSSGKSKSSSVTDSAEKKQADRRVVVKWTKNEEMAREAAKADAVVEKESQYVPVEEPRPKVVEPAQAIPPQQVQIAGPGDPLLDIIPFAGLLIPGGELAEHAKPAVNFGLGIGKPILLDSSKEARINLFLSSESRHDAKESPLTGPLTIRFINFRADYVWIAGNFRPFIAAGASSYQWKGMITQKSTNLQNKASRSDTGIDLTGGLEFVLTPSLFLAPELSGRIIGGEFDEILWSSNLSLRWRI